MTPSSLILDFIHPGIRIVKISRPSVLNALNTQVLLELKEVLTQEAEDPKTRVLILTGDGDKAFIAGADISEMKDMVPGEAIQFAQLGHEVTKLLELMPKPTIAAVNGYALGGGAELAIACDFIIASDRAVFGQPEVSLGVLPGFGGTVRLSKSIGIPRAKEMIFSGRRYKAEEALSIGLVNQIYPASELMAKVLELATTISQQSQEALARAKRLLNDFSESSGLSHKLDAEAMAFGHLFGHRDQKEGMNAFAEKRKPKFVGLE